MQWRVPRADVAVDEELIEAVRETVASGWWSMGPRVEEFERRFAALAGARHAFAVANGTAALDLALLAVGCGPGDEVVLPSLNFVAAANTVSHAGATPVFCDIRGGGDLNLDVADVEAAITPRTKFVLALHYGGWPCEIDGLAALTRDRGLTLVEDAAHAPGARPCGTVGAIGCFSFFSNKNLAMGEGGMVVTNDDALAEELRLLRSHGMTTLTWDRHRGHAHSYDVIRRGYNYRLDEIHAAIGLVQLDRLEQGNAVRRERLAEYRDRLHGVEGLEIAFAGADDEASACHLAVAILPQGTDREAVKQRLAEGGIQTSVHYPPIHTFSAYADADSQRRPLPRTEEVAPRLLTLPLFATMTPAQVDEVAQGLLAAVAEGRPARV
jgi:dTDP-4-amino-4,6-dideoxygalactose transaminase